MLPRENRLPSPDIKSVMRQGRRVNGDGVSLIYRKRDGTQAASRFAFVVPVSVDKRATARNRLKRLTRESVRLALPHLAPGWDGVFMVRRGLGGEFRVVDLMIRGVLQQSKIL